MLRNVSLLKIHLQCNAMQKKKKKWKASSSALPGKKQTYTVNILLKKIGH